MTLKRPKVINDLLAVDDTGTVANYIRQLETEIERLRVVLDDIATADPSMDDARALVNIAKEAFRRGNSK